MLEVDALVRLRRLRRAEALATQQDAAQRSAEQVAAEAALDHARRALAEEGGMAGTRPADFAAWLPLGLAQRSHCVKEHDVAARAAAEARVDLAAARISEEIVELLVARCRTARERAELRREQAWLDDLAAGRAARGAERPGVSL